MKLGPYELGPNNTPENGIYCGDARELAKAIPDESVDLIFTDPVYDRIDDYRWLAETAARVLKPDRACLVWSSKVTLPACQFAISKFLTYQSTLFYVVQAKQARPIFPYGLIPWTTPCLVFANGKYKCDPFIPDTFCTGKAAQSDFKWQKNTGVLIYWLKSFSKIGGIVFDPFSGSGSLPAACKMLGRRYLAFEIDMPTCIRARERVRNTQPPLFTLPPEQTRMEL